MPGSGSVMAAGFITAINIEMEGVISVDGERELLMATTGCNCFLISYYSFMLC